MHLTNCSPRKGGGCDFNDTHVNCRFDVGCALFCDVLMVLCCVCMLFLEILWQYGPHSVACDHYLRCVKYKCDCKCGCEDVQILCNIIISTDDGVIWVAVLFIMDFTIVLTFLNVQSAISSQFRAFSIFCLSIFWGDVFLFAVFLLFRFFVLHVFVLCCDLQLMTQFERDENIMEYFEMDYHV